MNDQELLQRYRQFLFILTGTIFIGVIIELWLTGHTETPTQYIPLILSGLGLITVAGSLFAPQRETILALRTVMIAVVLGSFLGIYEHLSANLEFAREIQPNATTSQVFLDALSGASPLLAPGILALGAILALAATYYHPAWKKHKS